MGFRRVLIANNGMAACKFLNSMSSAKNVLKEDPGTLFFGMVSTDDLQANSTYIQYLDFVIQVPSGPSRENYGNVDLIVSLAKNYECDAVWPGWGHASENDELARKLENAGIIWIGPTSDSMLRLGDKVESLLLAQKEGVPCAPWSGDRASTAAESALRDETHALSECDRIGYPVMLKSSSGGGGKGIRRVEKRQDCLSAYRQIQTEVVGGHIFAMKCINSCRHVEIQIVGDGEGNCVALSGRDCSVQRRHQKLVEEGPPPFLPDGVLEDIERAAERLCRAVKYKNAGTVEFLYAPESGRFYFLEVNCRLQVEHPVTELLCGVNLPFIQVAIAEGTVAFDKIPGLGEFIAKKKSNRGGLLDKHVIACRIVAEDPSNNWLPSSGEVFEIRQPNFDLFPSGSFSYFSISPSGSRIHEFADSQFGHVFMVGKNRDEAVRHLHRYLKELSLVGSVSSNIQFMTANVMDPKNSDFALTGPPNTNWIDTIISSRKSNLQHIHKSLSDQNDSAWALLAVCSHLAMSSFRSAEQELLRWVRKGHRAPHTPASYSERLVCPGGEKVILEAIRVGVHSLRIFISHEFHLDVDWVTGGGSNSNSRAIMTIRGVPGSVLVRLVAVSGTKFRVQIGKNISVWLQFEVEEDRSKLLAPMNGRLVRWLVPDNAVVSAGQRVCEIEAMKMVTVLAAKSGGTLKYTVQEGISFIEGDVLGALESFSSSCSLPSSPTGPSEALPGSVNDVLIDLVEQANACKKTCRREEVSRFLDGFTERFDFSNSDGFLSEFKNDEIHQVVSSFVQSEIWDLKCIPSESVGAENELLLLVSSCSDKDVIASWRRRSSLSARMRLIVSLIEMAGSLPPIPHEDLLDPRLHRPLMKLFASIRSSTGPSRVNTASSSLVSDEIKSGEEKLAERRALASEAGTFYIGDLPRMLLQGIQRLWTKSNKVAVSQELLIVEQITLKKDDGGQSIELHAPNAPLVMNACGMLALLVTMRTPEAPNGRRVVFIGNDITYQIGTFSVDEDQVYLQASQLARSFGIPRIYIACNSGARLGLCSEVQNLFRIEWNDPNNLSQGFQYLYLTKADYESVCAEKTVPPVIAKKFDHQIHGTIFIISDILGNEREFIGVENLVWSGAIAGESSRAYKEIFTLTYVTGRTVGIGAYIARLCQRVIQKIDSPILLTGFQALNKLIGSEVYQSNEEIGGVGVMFRNGVSHLTVNDDNEGIDAILNWLQFVPEAVGKPLPVHQAIIDSADRELPEPRDGGRSLVTEQSLFDAGSFLEVQTAWARSVIAGRARIGGIPVGVIVVETRQTHFFQPADPADPHSQSVARPQAGQVWYPDSAYKTAQAISDFNREGLPLMILANWRGFSGGQRDMFNEILKFGSYIVDALREYMQPVLVYLPPKAELRGGAWVVIDSRINPEQIEMFADPTARGGVLEPSGTTEIKFRSASLFDLMIRNDPRANQLTHNKHKLLNEHFNSVKPVLLQVANAFADMHDTPARMLHTGAIKAVVPWKHARQFFYQRLRFRLGLQSLCPPVSFSGSSGNEELNRLLLESNMQ